METSKVTDISTAAFLLRSAMTSSLPTIIVVATNALRSKLRDILVREVTREHNTNINILSLESMDDVDIVKGILNGSVETAGPLVFDNSAVLRHCTIADLRGETKKQPKSIRLTLDFEDPDRESVVFDLDHVTYRQHRVVQNKIGDQGGQVTQNTRLTVHGACDKKRF